MTRLHHECRVFTRHLVGRQPDAYVLAKYEQAHRVGAVPGGQPAPFDAWLCKIAAWHPAATRWVDAYTRVFYKGALARRKLVVLLAILECRPPFDAALDITDRGPVPKVWITIMAHAVAGFLFVLISALVLGPIHLACDLVRREGRALQPWCAGSQPPPRHGGGDAERLRDASPLEQPEVLTARQ